MDKLVQGKMVMALITPDLIDEWNKAVEVRHLYFILDYTTHYPTLWIGSENVKPEPWMQINTVAKSHLRLPLSDQHLRLGARDLEERFAKHGAALFISHRKDGKTKQQFVSIKIMAEASGPIHTVLDTIKKGTKKEYVHFKLNERW